MHAGAIIRQQKNVAVCLPAREYDQAAKICNSMENATFYFKAGLEGFPAYASDSQPCHMQWLLQLLVLTLNL